LGYLANHEALPSITCNFSGKWLSADGQYMAFPAKLKASQLQRHAMIPFLRGLIWLALVGPGGNLFIKKSEKQKAILQALFLCHNLAINREKKKPADIKQRTLENPILSNLTLL